jgi:hypothetical protein
MAALHKITEKGELRRKNLPDDNSVEFFSRIIRAEFISIMLNEKDFLFLRYRYNKFLVKENPLSFFLYPWLWLSGSCVSFLFLFL